MTAERQSSARPPAQPSYVFRGHVAQIHSVQVVRQNSRLVTGDADGWVVYWRLESKRPVAVWRAHDAAILGTAEWGSDKLVTHGRDNTLRIWQLRRTDEPNMSAVLPTDGPSTHRPKPWLLHTLPPSDGRVIKPPHAPSTRLSDAILVAVPARDDKKIEVYQFPEEKLAYVVPRVQPTDTGMVMAVKVTQHSPSKNTIVIAGYEGGFTAVHLLGPTSRQDSHAVELPAPRSAETIYLSQPHSQPVLSLDSAPDAKVYFTSSADAVVAAHRIPELPLTIDDMESPSESASIERISESLRSAEALSESSQVSVTPAIHNLHMSSTPETQDTNGLAVSQQQLASSASPFKPSHDNLHSIMSPPALTTGVVTPKAQPGLDGPNPPAQTPQGPLTSSKRPIASSSSASSTASFPKQQTTPSTASSTTPLKPSGLASLLSSAPANPADTLTIPSTRKLTVEPPYKSVQTKHAGQQSLSVRSDGRLLVTSGWDSKIRIYSAKTLKEMAVLKWHKEGVYATAFSEIIDDSPATSSTEGIDGALTGLGKLQHQRERQIQMKHWVVAGAKDGKVSLWEVF